MPSSLPARVNARMRNGLPTLLCCLLAGAAHADDALHTYASLMYTHDDNLFRLSENNPGYENTRGDNSKQLLAGLVFNQTYGREVISLQAKVSKVSFDHFTQLDYNGKDFLADLVWHLGNHLEGKVGGVYNEVLAPYTDVVTRDRNLRTQQRVYADGSWAFHPSWRLRAGIERQRYRYDLTSQAYNNRTDSSVESGIDYVASTGSTIGIQARNVRGQYDAPRVVGQRLVDDASRQKELKLRVFWKVTPVTDVQFLSGWAKRTHAFYSERDASGFNTRLSAATALAGTVRANASVWREFAGVESAVVSYSLNTGANIGASWAMTSKLQLDAQAKYQKRNFKGLLATTSSLDLSDRTHSNSLGVTYAPMRSVQVSVSGFHESRNGVSLFNNGNYRAKGVSVNLNAQY